MSEISPTVDVDFSKKVTESVLLWRKQEALPLLYSQALLDKTALQYAHDLVAAQRLTHSLSGKSPLERTRLQGDTATKVGEVIAVAVKPAQVIEGWRESSTHNELVTGDEWRQYGLASLTLNDDEGRTLVVMLFSNSLIQTQEIDEKTLTLSLLPTIKPSTVLVRHLGKSINFHTDTSPRSSNTIVITHEDDTTTLPLSGLYSLVYEGLTYNRIFIRG